MDRWAELYASGLSSNDIGMSEDRHGRVVRQHLACRGLTRDRDIAVARARANPNVRHDLFATPSPAAAWVIGLILGDGHVRDVPSQRAIYVLGTEQVTRAVARLVGCSEPSFDGAGFRGIWKARWASVAHVRALAQLGISGAKARRARLPFLSDAVLPHLVRGLWDADGSWRVRGNSTDTKLTTASEVLAQQLHALLGGRIDLHEHVFAGVLRRAFNVQLRVAETRRFAAWAYAGSMPDTRCERKYQQACGALDPAGASSR